MSGDEMMDLIAGMAPAKRNERMRVAHLAGHDACELCGRALKAGAPVLEIQTDRGVMPFGPECAKKIESAMAAV